ncbi:hypothetical protein [Methylobacterium gnaphalii]|uniref:Antirepressor protein C-terminal domain-containing protein n=1 Tax=Methylobacterium gnaphalii TaxID=1010610 RepID=A0A512JIM3_9HYPH|nr:hypothetical protein [Methylobacterium gnaphalii]GEP09784.1 hypothetical protein MGN01_16290 [Methylobacterium gnaphalii]GJD67301.1 hypothetical protein MMMDOFMJ_0215 [Methylobacterium gnaphalii]GLS49814.1 hypothetical protein GCM10007885_26660 [Methylobacterium gnaphalii]
MTGGPPLKRRQISALRALKVNPAGLRRKAYPRVVPMLVVYGYVEVRPSILAGGETAWFLTQAGCDRLRTIGSGEPSDPN